MKSIIEFFVKYKIWANAIIFIIFAGGIFSLLQLKNSAFPLVASTNVLATVVYPGASPQEIEEGIVLKIEQALEGVEGIKKVTSTSVENLATINVEIFSNYDIDQMVTEVKNAVDQISSFPTGAEKPNIYKQPPLDLVAFLVLKGDASLMTLKRYVDIIEDDLLQDKYISQVTVTGVPDLEISVEVPETVLRQNRLTFDDVGNAIRLNNTDISAGSIKSADEEVRIRSNAKEIEASKLENIILRSRADGSQIRLGDIAIIKEQFADSPNKTIYDGQNAISIRVDKLQSEDILKIRDRLLTYIEEFNASHQDAGLIMTNDFAQNLIDRRNLLLENGGTGLLLVLIVLGMFLSLRLSAWVAFGIPFSFLGMLIAYSLMGGTINLISLFGMILVIGILVDDGIVIAENVFSHYERGKSPVRAAIDGSAEILPSVFVSVSTTIMLFLVFFAADGFFGSITQTIATVVILTLAFSLVEAVFVLPAHLSEKSVLSGASKEPTNVFQKLSARLRLFFENIIAFLRDKAYGGLLKIVIRNRYIFGLIPILFIMIVGALMGGRYIKFTFFPVIPADDIQVGLVLSSGTREQITEEKLRQIGERILTINEAYKEQYDIDDIVESIQINIGSGAGENGSHAGSISAALVNSKLRKSITDLEIISSMREAIGEVPEAKKLIVGGGNRFGKPVSLSLRSTNLEEIQSFSDELKAQMRTRPNLRDVIDNNVIGNREVYIELKDKAYALGMTRQEIARQIRQGFFGEEVQRLQKGKNELRVWVRYTQDDRTSIGKLEQMRIKTRTGEEYPLIDLVDYEVGRSIVSINHLDGGREISVDADVVNEGISVPDELSYIKDSIMPPLFAKYPSVTLREGGQAEETAKLQQNVLPMFFLAIIGMLIVIALVFRSASQALLMLPMIFIGIFCAFLGHGIEDFLQGDTIVPVSMLSVFGILALIGVIVNDTVIFLNKFNLLIQEGYNFKKAVYEAGRARFRAILLTSITTVVGLYPIILEQSFQAAFLKPLAISMAYGVLFGTAFILVCFPAYLMIANDMRRGVNFMLTGVWRSAEEVEPAYREIKRLNEHS